MDSVNCYLVTLICGSKIKVHSEEVFRGKPKSILKDCTVFMVEDRINAAFNAELILSVDKIESPAVVDNQ